MAVVCKNTQACAFAIFILFGQYLFISYGLFDTNIIIICASAILFLLATLICLLLLYLATFILPAHDSIFLDLVRLVAGMVLQSLAKKSYHKLEDKCKLFRVTQNKFLRNVLQQHKTTEYGQQFNFGEILSPYNFQCKHPVTSYIHYKPFMERAANGEEGVISHERPVLIALTSGTTGDSKMFARFSNRRKKFFQNFLIMFEMLSRKSVRFNLLQKICTPYTHFPKMYSKGGIILGPSSILLNLSKSTLMNYSTPVAGFRLTNVKHSMYIHALFAIRDRNLGAFAGNFVSSILKLFNTIETQWKQLVTDLRTGTLDRNINLPEDIKSELEKDLYPLPDRAAELELEFRKGFQDIANRIWPNLNFISAVTGGSMDIYYQTLSKKYIGDIVVYSSILGCTEGFLGLNLWPEAVQGTTPRYVLCPDDIFYEFMPLSESSKENPEVLLSDGLEIGDCYQLLLTNTEGLYRYRLDDVFKVVDFWYQSPIVEFQYRIGEMFNISGKKFTEIIIRQSITSAVASVLPSVDMQDYACCENILYHKVTGMETDDDDFDFVAFLEVGVDGQDSHDVKTVLENEINQNLLNLTIPDGLPNRNIGGVIRLVLVKPGAFNALVSYILSNCTTAPGQIKVPRKLRKLEWIKLLLDYDV